MTIAQQLKIKDFPFVIKDKRGNEIYYENSNGFWSKREYDANGNQTKFENSDGNWEKLEYDANGDQIKFETSWGSWVKRSYYETRDGLKYNKKPKVEVELSLEEIATKFGVDVNQLKIKK